MQSSAARAISCSSPNALRTPWTEANAVLARWANAEEYRAFVLGSAVHSSNSRDVGRLPRIALDETADESIYQRIIAEISVARPLPSEPMEETFWSISVRLRRRTAGSSSGANVH
jgi:hypothetical protein